jgi:hypothetical protein
VIAPRIQGEKPTRSCTILFPGLLGPDAPLQELPRGDWPDKTRLSSLLTILNRGRSEPRPHAPYEQLALTQLGIAVPEGGELPVASLRAFATHTQQANLWCLDPAYVELDREGASLTALDALELSAAESAQLIDSINQHFAGDLSVTAYSPQQWLLQRPMQLHTHTPSQTLWRQLGEMLPAGPDAGAWRRLLNEMQMLLHAHPANQARMEQGRLPVNSLWLWGGGKLVRSAAHCDRVYADDELVRLAAAYSGLEHAPLPDTIEAAITGTRRSLLVCNTHLVALMRKDVYAWFAALEHLEQAYLGPVLNLLHKAELDAVSILSDSMQIVLTRRDLRRWRLGNRNLAELVLGLRGKMRV